MPERRALLVLPRSIRLLLLLDDKPVVRKAGLSPQNDDFNIPGDAGTVEARHNEVLRAVRDVEKHAVILQNTRHLEHTRQHPISLSRTGYM